MTVKMVEEIWIDFITRFVTDSAPFSGQNRSKHTLAHMWKSQHTQSHTQTYTYSYIDIHRHTRDTEKRKKTSTNPVHVHTTFHTICWRAYASKPCTLPLHCSHLVQVRLYCSVADRIIYKWHLTCAPTYAIPMYNTNPKPDWILPLRHELETLLN